MTSTRPGTGAGEEVDCASCAHRALADAGRCRLKHACVNDRYARRIDRFFNWNPELANSYIAAPHFEVRAIAAKHASRIPAAATARRSRGDRALERRAATAEAAGAPIAERCSS